MNTPQCGFAKNRLMIWLGATVAVPLIYAFAVWNSLRKIDTFCNNVQIGVAVGALRQIGRIPGWLYVDRLSTQRTRDGSLLLQLALLRLENISAGLKLQQRM